MLISIIRYLQGYLCIRIIGYSPERFLNLCSHKNIYLWGLKPVGNHYQLFITIKDFRRLKPIMKKTGTKVIIVKRLGLPFFLHKYRKRKVFFGSAILCMLLIYLMSLFIWNIDIDGNFSRTDETILEFLETRNVSHGMRKNQVRCERIVKDIRKEYDDIVWVSASVKGSRLLIKVKENTDTFTEKQSQEELPTDIIAEKNGKITSIVTRNGIPLVKPGDNVKKGDILVSGSVEVKNDAGEVINYQYHTSDADIEAETLLEYESEHSFSHQKKQYSGRKKQISYVKIGNTVCTVGNLRQRYQKSELCSSETQLKLGESFFLPISYGIIEMKEYALKENVYTNDEMRILLSEEFQKFCKDLEIQKKQILEKDVKIYLQKNTAKAKGTLRILEPIGQAQSAERIDF